MKKIAWFYFKEESILNNSIVRGINNTLLVLLILLPPCNPSLNIQLSYLNLLAIIILCPMITGFCIDRVLKCTKFYEWDYKERKKKERFIIGYGGICTILSICLMLSLCIFHNTLYSREDVPIFVMGVIALPPIIFIINIINIPSLFYSFLKEELQTDKLHILKEMPNNWEKEKIDDITEELVSRCNGRD